MSLVSIIFPMFFTVTDTMYKFYGGLEVRTLYLAKLLGEDGHEVNVLAPRGSHLSYKNVKVLTGNYRPWDGKTLHPVDLEKDLVESNLDVLGESDAVLEDNHFHYYHYLKSKETESFPHLAMSWDHHPDNISSLPNFPCHIIAVSKWVMSALREKFKNLGHYFYWAYSGLVLENYPEVDIHDKQENLYIFLARFSMVKSPHVIIELAKEFPDDEFVLMGDTLFTQEGGYARLILEESDELDNVKILFNASWDEKIEYLKRANGLLHPGFWCIPAYETVVTDKGLVRISDLAVGDFVLTHDGTFQKVLNKFEKEYDGELITIHPYYATPFDVTPEHKIMTKEGYKHACELTTDDLLLRTKSPNENTINSINLLDYIEFPDAKLVKKQTLSGENVVFRRYRIKFEKSYEYYGEQNRGHPFPEVLTIDDDFIHLCAAYVCEGSTTQDMVAFAFGKDEYMDIWERISERLMCSYRLRDEGEWCEVFLNSRVYPQLMEKWFGKGAKNKHLPSWIWKLSDEYKRKFIEYLIYYDGHVEKKTGIKSYTTSSKTLAYQVKLLAQSIGMNCAVTKGKGYSKTFNSKTKFYEGCYRLRFNEGRSNYLVREGNNEYVKIYKIEKKQYKGVVYDIEVEKNHNFVLGDVVVSNSEPLGWDMLEGLLYGAKVLAYDRGAVREIYRNGKHGYIVPFASTEEENIENYKRAFRNFRNLKVDREECRNRVLEYFDFKKNSYSVYKKVLFDNRNLNKPNR